MYATEQSAQGTMQLFLSKDESSDDCCPSTKCTNISCLEGNSDMPSDHMK